MNSKDAALKLNNNQYREEGSPELFAALKDAGLVAVFGYSDDLIEFRGAIYDEVGASTAYLTSSGLLVNDCESDSCPHFAHAKKQATTIKALWCDGGFSWRYETTIPHETFVILDGDETYCEGIVFALADVGEEK